MLDAIALGPPFSIQQILASQPAGSALVTVSQDARDLDLKENVAPQRHGHGVARRPILFIRKHLEPFSVDGLPVLLFPQVDGHPNNMIR